MKNLTLTLHCEFSEAELQEKAQEMSAAMLLYDDVEAEKREATKTYTDQLKELRGRCRSLSKAIRAKGEQRPVQCRVLFHCPQVGTKRIVRVDTGEVVREEAMSNDERQENLFGEMNELERMYSAPDRRTDEVPSHEDATKGEFELNEDDQEQN